jgi:hypothetical protein
MVAAGELTGNRVYRFSSVIVKSFVQLISKSTVYLTKGRARDNGKSETG